jgi:hypothetical protein
MKLYNRSNSTSHDYSDFKFSVFADFDLGNPSDDYVGTDVGRNMFYAYNGDNFDESVQGRAGYGSSNPAQGVKFLDNTIDHSVNYNIGGGLNGDPALDVHYALYQRNRWQNNQPMYYGGNGLNGPCVNTSQPTNFMFDGNPWSEANPCPNSSGTPNPTGDRRMIGGPNVPTQFNHGTSMEFNYAYVFATNPTGSSSASGVNALQATADAIQNFYDNTVVGIEDPKSSSIDFALYPNPAKDIIYLTLQEKQFDAQLLNVSGAVIRNLSNETTIDVSDLAPGVYFIRIQSLNSIGTKKLIISH